ncbi:M16 family metallopeptidase [Thermotalea metallivorans]|uniref:Putative zinc protease n=1 Tax=Thermotalea metallivorans TaxID=520762 RepID=A0A140L2C1_9FIRM|nr:pitrilysin family protein [Thermotalea metallivorans]KXG74696.1 putative zinc protease [Thermotalea metallivorans]
MKKEIFNSMEQTLENGIQLISIKKDTRIFSFHVGIRIGAMYENIEEKGICHFIEHMLFQGTKKRNNHQINQALEERAGSYNAYTDYVSTVFSITALAEELESSVELLSDLITNPTFPEKEMEKERRVILTEIKTNLDDVEQYSYQKVNEIAFTHSPLRYDVIGTEDTIRRFTKNQLEAFYHTHYIPNRCIISVVSPYDHDTLRILVEKYFGNWRKKEGAPQQIVVEKNRPVEKKSYKSNIEQNTLIYLYTFYGLTRKEELALEILNYKLGESANSILFKALREEKGLSYDIYSELDATEGIKTLYIYTAVGEEDIWEAKKIIEDCIAKIKGREIHLDKQNITHMKKVMKTAVASILEDSEGLGHYVLHQKITGKKIDAFVEDMEELDHIQMDDIYWVAEKVLANPTVHILMGRKKKL